VQDEASGPFQKLRQSKPSMVRFMPKHSYPHDLLFEVQGLDMVHEARLIGSFDIEFECLTLI